MKLIGKIWEKSGDGEKEKEKSKLIRSNFCLLRYYMKTSE